MPANIRLLLLAHVLSIFLIGSVHAVCPAGDLNNDCLVDFLDFQLFTEQWLEPSGSGEQMNFADLDGADGVNMSDLALFVQSWHQAGIPLVINEFMASNNDMIADPQGQFDDWIEIWNSGLEPIDVGGMFLTDNLSDPMKWRIPIDMRSITTIPAGGYLLIWADQDSTDFGLHANFKLDADGEEIGLFDKDGVTLIDSIGFPEQTTDISYGRDPETNGEIRFFAKPTPGAQNDGAYLDEVDVPEFSHKRGFYDAPFYLTLATETKNAIIYYTLDGSEPYEFTGRFPNGIIYTGPIYISRNTCLRARAIKQGWKPSAVKTHTYLLNANEAVKSLPIISLVGDEAKTLYEPDGVMAVVGGSYGGNGWVFDGPGSYNNMMGRGMTFERPVSFEWIMPEDNSGSQVDCGLRVHGSDYMRPRYRRQNGYWSGDGKIAFRLYFRDRYGLDWLEYPLFPFEVDCFKSIVIRSGHNDRTNPFIKDELNRRLQKDMGHVSSGGRMANLFINGEYKGYFNPCEHIKDAFCQEWYRSDEPWDVMTMSGIRDGTIAGWNTMLNYARNNDLSNDAHYQEMGKRLDIPAFIDYLILQLWAANWDWPQNNWSAAAEQSANGIWRFYVWDSEGTFESGDLSHTGFSDFPSWAGGNRGLNGLQEPISQIYRALKANPTFRQTFGDRLYKHFYNGGALTETNITKRFTELRNEMLGVLPNMNTYILTGWVPNRLNIFLDVCVREGVYTYQGPKFSINGIESYGGYISSNDILTIADHGRYETIHYTLDGSDPIRSDIPPQDGQDEDEITILIAETTPKRVLVPVRPVSTDWNSSTTFDDSSWLYTTSSPGGVGFEISTGYESLISLDLGESMYSRNSTCYIRIPFTFSGEIENIGSAVLNIRYDDGFVAYLNGTEIARRNADQILTWNSSANASHPDADAVQFESIDISDSINLLKEGRNLLAIHGLNESATSPDFLISAELIAGPVDSDGTLLPGATKYSESITLPYSSHVKARTFDGDTWSALSEAVFAVGPVAENLRITEIMYNPQDSSGEFIELKNIGTETINLNLVSFTNGIDFAFPSLELAAGEYIIVAQDQNALKARYSTAIKIAGQYSGRLDNAGERITLADAIGRTILDFKYKDGWYPITDGEDFSLTIIDVENPDPNSWDEKDAWRPSAYAGGSPGQDDSGILPNPVGVVINEVLAHSHADTSDWIELHNTTSTAIDIGGWYLSDSENNLKKYKIANGTTIGPNRYYVLYENLHFGNVNDPGCIEPFALSENGDHLYLSSAHNNILTGYRTEEDFGASQTGVSIGRYYKYSTGNYNFVAMEQITHGSANSYPKVGPIVISEIMYNPEWPFGGSYINDEYEYVELCNISSEPVTLYDYETGEAWKFTDGIEFVFPTNAPTTIPAGGYLLVVKNPEVFSLRYSGVTAEKIFGPYDGKLSNAGESLELSMPGDIDMAGERLYIRIDRVNYSDGSHPENCPGGIDLWPIAPDGSGKSLTRKVLSEYGNDLANWGVSTPSPGE
ncbi:MAG: lamin tail domain-containing protein [Sedimentisphaerales bacterium]|nr:lamin tail domain-containing protein [Sedimentisphaerales bacterium]